MKCFECGKEMVEKNSVFKCICGCGCEWAEELQGYLTFREEK